MRVIDNNQSPATDWRFPDHRSPAAGIAQSGAPGAFFLKEVTIELGFIRYAWALGKIQRHTLDPQIGQVWREVFSAGCEGYGHGTLRFLHEIWVMQVVPGVRELMAKAEGTVATVGAVELLDRLIPADRAVQGSVLERDQHIGDGAEVERIGWPGKTVTNGNTTKSQQDCVRQ